MVDKIGIDLSVGTGVVLENNKVGTILSFEGSKAVVQLDNSSEIVSTECCEINKLIVFM